MQVKALDHVNIVSNDLERSARFYAEVVGLMRHDPPEPLEPSLIQWMHDGEGRPVLHLVSKDRRDSANRDSQPGGPTGAVHHVALNCAGHADFIARLDEMGVAYRQSGVSGIGLKQVFLTDPDNVLLELNFHDG